MLNRNGVIVDHIWEDGHAVLMACVRQRPTGGPDSLGTPLLQADIASLLLYAYDMETDADTPIVGFDGVSLSPATYWFDTLQGWDVDELGHNFRYTLGTGAAANGNHTTRVMIKITLSAALGSVIGWIKYSLPVRPTSAG